MRIKSVTVRNYRIHRELTVAFDASRTLIGGPNESGKSTLVEAMHRALFLKSKVTGDAQKSMVSSTHAGSPEVEICFTANDVDYMLVKRFSGSTGTAKLTQVGGAMWQAEEAEARLADLLKVESTGGGRGVADRVAQQWAHLWVWQGRAGDDPSAHATQQRDGLLQRLQEVGGAAALQSEVDSQVAHKFATARDEIFTQGGKPRAGSALEVAEAAFAEAENDRKSAWQRLESLRGHMIAFEQAALTIARTGEDLVRIARENEELEGRANLLNQLRHKEANDQAHAEAALEKVRLAQQADQQIVELRKKHHALETVMQPKNHQAQELNERWEAAKVRANRAMQEYDARAAKSREARERRDLAAAAVTLFEKQLVVQTLQEREVQAGRHQAELLVLRGDLARLPKVTPAKIKTLQKWETETAEAEAAVRAMAAGIEVLAAGDTVQVGESTLAEGDTQVVTERTEVRIGESVRLRISPGGGASLQEAKHKAAEARHKLSAELAELGVANLAEAAEALARKNELEGKLQQVEARLDGLDAQKLPALLAAARESLTSAEAEVARRAANLGETKAPVRMEEAKHWLEAERLAAEQAEEGQARARVERETAQAALQGAEKEFNSHRTSLDKQNHELITLNAQLKMLLETHGDDGVRGEANKAALAAREQAEMQLAHTRKEIGELQPDMLGADQARVKRARDQALEIKQAAERHHAVAQAALRSDGTDDPEATMKLAEARARSASAHLASVRCSAEAISLLHRLFVDEQRSLAEEFTRPFAQRISGYLQCLFGPGTQALVTLSENEFQALQLYRPGQGDGAAVPFSSLSGGAREQVAAAVRLAMAELLAEDHGGCLPVVFDDAFAYSDPERVRQLQRMLDLAASRGLQIVVLTCNPSDYASLGAKQVALKKDTQLQVV